MFDAKEAREKAKQHKERNEASFRKEYPRNLADELNCIKKEIKEYAAAGYHDVYVRMNDDYVKDIKANLRKEGFKVSWFVARGRYYKVSW